MLSCNGVAEESKTSALIWQQYSEVCWAKRKKISVTYPHISCEASWPANHKHTALRGSIHSKYTDTYRQENTTGRKMESE